MSQPARRLLGKKNSNVASTARRSARMSTSAATGARAPKKIHDQAPFNAS